MSYRPTPQNTGLYRFPGGGSRFLGPSQMTNLPAWSSIGRKKVDQRSTDLGRPTLARNLSSAAFVSNCRVRQSSKRLTEVSAVGSLSRRARKILPLGASGSRARVEDGP